MEDNRFALGGFHRQPLLVGLLGDVDQRLAAEATAVRFNRRAEINATRHLFKVPAPVWEVRVIEGDRLHGPCRR